MARGLASKRRASASGKTGSVVVFLHGYGADGADLLGLADPLAPHLPDTVFLAPDAPEQSTVNPMGYQWFPIPWLDGSDVGEAEVAMDRAVDDLNGWLDGVLAEEGIAADRLVLVGFSQGTMMALHVALRRAESVAALVGFSGRLLRPEVLEDEIKVRPPVLLIHGDQDDVVPPASLPAAAEALQAAGVDVFAHISKGTAHGIAPDGLQVALAFIRDRLGLDTA
ncbi:Carboxylesterase 2 [Rhodobacteraceae bacterium THAF1]|uniref:alpha/beta hydrolase n=1 Tax=Palleronia sp. THAF1 TaxID=2587842 RepID=UPI000F3D4422|nr:alpha/beta fold hydrolase [Palleronia sp. THAF1]QFU09196.1 Carboxylesterase 2 [Palleronia sp. THAF1]VDC27301.1 Carboxylesterase 2 [Rhodobacteraceae bacterium THAF1]